MSEDAEPEEDELEGLTPAQRELVEKMKEDFGEHFHGWVFIVLPDVTTKPTFGYGGGAHQAMGLLADTLDSLVRRL